MYGYGQVLGLEELDGDEDDDGSAEGGKLAVLFDRSIRLLEVDDEALAVQLRDWRLMFHGASLADAGGDEKRRRSVCIVVVS